MASLKLPLSLQLLGALPFWWTLETEMSLKKLA
jgi:hypothetical protein